MATDGQLSQTFREALRIWDAQKAEGIPVAERLRGLEQTLRAAWPFTREWKFLCGTCGDLGLVWADCDGSPFCGREKRHLAHTFGRPCWCALGAKFKPKAKPAPEDFAAAGKTTKPTRLGR